MKKLIFSALAFIALSLQLHAQVPNPGFEQLNADGTVRNWGKIYLMPVTVDSSGNSYSDSVIFNNYFYFSSTDAHSGSRAMEISNAYNYTRSECIVGAAGADMDSVFAAFGSFDYLPATVIPATFSFYYKFFPMNNDSGIAQLGVYDSFMNEIGAAEIIISGTHAAYTLASTPVVMTGTASVGYISVYFSNSTGGHPATFGTRLLVDDIGASPSGIDDIRAESIALSCYPNPALDNINLLLSGVSRDVAAVIEVTDVAGRQMQQKEVTVKAGQPLQVDVKNYATGVYIATITTAYGKFTSRFIK